MPVTTRKRKATKPAVISSTTTTPVKTEIQFKDDDPFEQAFNPIVFDESNNENDSDFSEYDGGTTRRKKSKMKAKTKKPKIHNQHPTPPLALPDISSDETDTMSDDDADGLWSTQSHVTSALTVQQNQMPDILQIQINATPGQPTSINLNIADLLRLYNSRPQHPSSKAKSAIAPSPSPVPSSSQCSMTEKKNHAGFIDLPAELRQRVYRLVFVRDEPIMFHMREEFCRSSAFLRTCSVVAAEGAAVLYGENVFHFERTHERRGKFFVHGWKEVGFKNIRRFLEVIGPYNVANLKYLSFVLEDALGFSSPLMESSERRYVNDPVLQRIFKIIGANATLHKLGITFSSRTQVCTSDYHFLKALTGIKCHEFHNVPRLRGCTSRIQDYVVEKLTELMVVPRPDEHEVDKSKARTMVKMPHERPGGGRLLW